MDDAYLISFYRKHLFRIETEVWTHANGSGQNWSTTRPSLPDGNYRYGIGLYAVDFDFCRGANVTNGCP